MMSFTMTMPRPSIVCISSRTPSRSSWSACPRVAAPGGKAFNRSRSNASRFVSMFFGMFAIGVVYRNCAARTAHGSSPEHAHLHDEITEAGDERDEGADLADDGEG